MAKKSVSNTDRDLNISGDFVKVFDHEDYSPSLCADGKK